MSESELLIRKIALKDVELWVLQGKDLQVELYKAYTQIDYELKEIEGEL
tara:strand:- start:1262 stop:1408 length:147 start_codon:yes stop_codon:yes gene_type:complete